MLKSITLNLTEGARGFTLLEVIIAIALLFIIMTPLIAYIYRNDTLVKAEEQITGMCILEQDVSILQCGSDQFLPVKHTIINGGDWITRIDRSGDGLYTFILTVSKNGKERGRIVVYRNSDK